MTRSFTSKRIYLVFLVVVVIFGFSLVSSGKFHFYLLGKIEETRAICEPCFFLIFRLFISINTIGTVTFFSLFIIKLYKYLKIYKSNLFNKYLLI